MNCLHESLTGKNGFVNVAQCAISNLEVHFHFFDTTRELKTYHKYIHEIISEFNIFLLSKLKELINVFETGEYKSGYSLIVFYRMIIKTNHDYYRNLLLYKTAEFIIKSSSARQQKGDKETEELLDLLVMTSW